MVYALIRYDAMVLAIAECHQVDEVKDLRDKARALEEYWKQARNTEAERKAADIRLRAERRAGELLKELARATPQEVAAAGGNAKAGNVLPANVADSSPYREALEKSNIPPRTAIRYQQLANIPAEDFEKALADPASKPTTRGLIREIRNQEPHIDPDALWPWIFKTFVARLAKPVSAKNVHARGDVSRSWKSAISRRYPFRRARCLPPFFLDLVDAQHLVGHHGQAPLLDAVLPGPFAELRASGN